MTIASRIFCAAVLILAGALPGEAQTRAPLRPSPLLVTADMSALIQGLKVEKANDKAMADAQSQYDHARENGFARDLSPAMQVFVSAYVTHDSKEAQTQLAHLTRLEMGLAAYVEHNYLLAQTMWLPLAQGGDREAQIDAGLLYASGLNGASQSDTEAAKWYALAAAQGDPVAQENLATLYQAGRGVPQDLAHADMWLALAISQDIRAGQASIAVSLARKRETLEAGMSPDDVARVKAMAAACNQARYVKCD